MRVLVTGGVGFIGHAVALDLTRAGNDVTVLRRDPADGAVPPAGAAVACADLRDAARVGEIVRAGRFDAVVHLGGLSCARRSVEQPLEYFAVNVGGTLNVLRALQEHPGAERPPAFVYSSSTLVYGSRRTGRVDEDAAPEPETPYADTKVAAERLIAAYAATGACAAAILRIFNVGGGVAGVCDTDRTRLLPTLLDAAAGHRDSVTLVGDGTGVCDFVHVADVAAAVRAALVRVVPGACPVFNVGSGRGTRLIDLLHEVEQVTGRSIPLRFAPDARAPGGLVAGVDRARDALGWQPVRSDLQALVADAWACWPAGVGGR